MVAGWQSGGQAPMSDIHSTINGTLITLGPAFTANPTTNYHHDLCEAEFYGWMPFLAPT